MNDLDWKQPALIGGLIVGILSAIPGINLANCCCLWALSGGIVAVMITVRRSQRPVKMSEGAHIALMAGLIGAAIFCALSIPLILSGVATKFSLKLMEWMMGLVNDANLQAKMRDAMEQVSNQSGVRILVNELPWLFGKALVFCGFTVLGGLLGIVLFEKRKGEIPPSPYPPEYPPDYPPPPPPSGNQGGWPQS